ncbi:MAG: hypothetical protein ACK5L3_11480 [Oscillospiraceae bacterium]
MLEFLKTILGEAYTEEIDKKVSAEIGKAFVLKADFNEAKKGLTEQLETANKTIEEMKALDPDALKKSAEDYKAKYEGEVAARKKDDEDRAYNAVIAAKTANEKFSSEAAKKAFISDLREKGLKVDGETLLGYDDFKKAYVEADPNAFASDKKPPVFSQPGTSAAGAVTDEKAYMDSVYKGNPFYK